MEGAKQAVPFPVLYSPFASRISQHADTVDRGTVRWLYSCHALANNAAYRQFSATRIGRLAARFHPEARPGVLQLISDWYGWMFFRDDQRDETDLGRQPETLATANSRLLQILGGSIPAHDEPPLAHTLWDLRRRLFARSPSRAWADRFVRSVGEHFDSTVWEADNRARRITPDMQTYARMRPITGGLNIDTAFVEIAEGISLPPEIREHTAVRTLTRLSNNAVCWANDIISLDKELARGDVHNLVLVLQGAHGLDLQTALSRAVEIHNAEVQTFVEMLPELPSFGKEEDRSLRRFVAVLQARMRGYLDWAGESRRYQAARDVPAAKCGNLNDRRR